MSMKSSALQGIRKEKGWTWCTGIRTGYISSGHDRYACS
nr:MAG TPA: hypothetical protein [Caudoviricetes sp.]